MVTAKELEERHAKAWEELNGELFAANEIAEELRVRLRDATVRAGNLRGDEESFGIMINCVAAIREVDTAISYIEASRS